MSMNTITIDSSSIELENGENLRDLAVGHSVELCEQTPHPGYWIAAAFHGEYRDQVTLRPAVNVTDCAAVEPGCRYAGVAHAHPVDSSGKVYARPGSA